MSPSLSTAQFLSYCQDLLQAEKVTKMEYIHHHTKKISCLDHSLFVAYVSYLLAKNLGGDVQACVRGALLHDLYLCDWKQENIGKVKSLFIHPALAVKNAETLDITEKEKYIIQNHMWPINIKNVPATKEEIIVSTADKMCAMAEISGIYWSLKCIPFLRIAKLSVGRIRYKKTFADSSNKL